MPKGFKSLGKETLMRLLGVNGEAAAAKDF
jgi:hypothetical protein